MGVALDVHFPDLQFSLLGVADVEEEAEEEEGGEGEDAGDAGELGEEAVGAGGAEFLGEGLHGFSRRMG